MTLRFARASVNVLFLVHGLVVATWISRIPAIQNHLHLSPGALGLSLLGTAVGAMLSMPLTGVLVNRYGSRRVSILSSVFFAAAVILPSLAVNAPSLAAALALFGMTAGAMDVAMNAQAVEVEHEHGRPLMSGFHGFFSLGGMLGSALGGWVAKQGITPFPHFAGAAVAFGLLMLPSFFYLLPDASAQPASASPGFRLTRALLALIVLAFCILLGEGAMADWAGVYLRDSLHAGEDLAALGYATFSLTMALGRFLGDRVTLHLGRIPIVRYGSALAAAGLALGLLLGTIPAALLAFACVGAGFSVVVPLVFGAAARAGGRAAGTSLATVTTAGYLGFVVGPPFIGLAADHITLRAALGFVVLLSAVATTLAPAVEPYRGL